MLALTLRPGTYIVAIHPDGTETKFHYVGGIGQIRIGIDAPAKIKILRDKHLPGGNK